MSSPLAERMRPKTLEKYFGQKQIIGSVTTVYNSIVKGIVPSMILWGPPGVGKTTLAYLIAEKANKNIHTISAISSGVKDVREVIQKVENSGLFNQKGTILFIDEIHRFSKSQQDSLLAGVEEGWVTLVAATTENPSVSINSALMSRSLVLPLNPLQDEDVVELLKKALTSEKGLKNKYACQDEALIHIARSSGGDARRALIALETSAGVADSEKRLEITLSDAEVAVQRAALRYDKAGDEHYNVISAYIKSVRGSDVDAAIHYLARMAESGEDPKFIARRLVILEVKILA